jgi:hypothetical protein
MPNHQEQETDEAGAAQISEPRLEAVETARENWILVAAGICAAGAAYPALLVMIFFALGLVVEVIAHLARPEPSIFPQLVTIVPALIMGAAFALAAGCIGAVWSGFLSLIVVPVFYLFAKSLRLRANLVWLGAICGGLVGFVGVLPFLLGFRTSASADFMGMLLVAASGPCLTTVLGQLGGAWGGMHAERARKRANGNRFTHPEPPEKLMQFQIRHLLWVTVWVALLLTGIRLSGIPAQLILPVLFAWFVFQGATLYFGWLLVVRIWPWWRGRRSAARPPVQ